MSKHNRGWIRLDCSNPKCSAEFATRNYFPKCPKCKTSLRLNRKNPSLATVRKKEAKGRRTKRMTNDY